MNNILEGVNSRITEAEEWINDLEDGMVEITAAEQNIKKRMKDGGGIGRGDHFLFYKFIERTTER